ncbi:MAG: AI-2E family transporter [Candidatus Paceibacterota bacterium]|jgi:predicted PurR-regulated permease PerM
MDKKIIETSFFFILLTIATVMTAYVFKPFFNVLILSITLSVVFEPFYRRIFKSIIHQKSIASLLTIFLMLLIVLAPLILIGLQVFDQSQALYTNITSRNPHINSIAKLETLIETNLQKLFPKIPISIDLQSTINLSFKWVSNNIGPIFQGATELLTSLLISLIAVYYFLKDGSSLKRYLFTISPLSEKHNEEIFKKLKDTMTSVINGRIIIALAQGVVAGIGFWIFGIPNAVLWGFVAAITALVPLVGSALILVPIIAYSFISQSSINAIGLTAWSVILVGLIDNFLGPKLVERKIQIHPLLVLLSFLGGIELFGPIGFLAGPLIFSFFFTLLNIYPHLILKRDEII